ncbi:MAG TPA: carboxypeptidase regulatory-like domain-containing protein [Planctomycetaceae bacterium]|nr:carboxypeptidase regulatory-like domain-containing protein [Planctomycetaceae bacterium]HIQ22439.1 carboxypeptidase regulatory-like domain-containing protein [Planctomycetota bacterium]
MNGRFVIQQLAVWLAVAGFCAPPVAWAATPEKPSSPIADLMLHEGNTLVGQVVDAQGKPLADVPVSLRVAAGELAAGKTNAQGYFAFRGLRSGVYQIAIPAGVAMYRVWAPGTAPPAAQPGAMLVADGQTVRGQGCCQGLFGFLGKHPLLTAGLIAAAIAIPIAIAADKGPSSP